MKIIKVSGCEDCPYYFTNRDDSIDEKVEHCQKLNRDMRFMSIEKDCPLEDYISCKDGFSIVPNKALEKLGKEKIQKMNSCNDIRTKFDDMLENEFKKDQCEIIFFDNEKGKNWMLSDRILTKDELTFFNIKKRIAISKDTHDLICEMHKITCEHGYYFEKLESFLKEKNIDENDLFYYDGNNINVSTGSGVGTLCNKDIKGFLRLIEEQDNKTAREMLRDCIEKVKEKSKFNVDSFVDIVKNKEKLQ